MDASILQTYKSRILTHAASGPDPADKKAMCGAGQICVMTDVAWLVSCSECVDVMRGQVYEKPKPLWHAAFVPKEGRPFSFCGLYGSSFRIAEKVEDVNCSRCQYKISEASS